MIKFYNSMCEGEMELHIKFTNCMFNVHVIRYFRMCFDPYVIEQYTHLQVDVSIATNIKWHLTPKVQINAVPTFVHLYNLYSSQNSNWRYFVLVVVTCYDECTLVAMFRRGQVIMLLWSLKLIRWLLLIQSTGTLQIPRDSCRWLDCKI